MSNLENLELRVNLLQKSVDLNNVSMSAVVDKLCKDLPEINKCITQLHLHNEILHARLNRLENLNKLRVVKNA